MNSNTALLIVVTVSLLIGGYMMGWFDFLKPERQPYVKPDVEEVIYTQDVSEGEPLRPRDACQTLCLEKLSQGVDLSDGPCLSNSITEDWACDVAHSPREEVDGDPNNQCSEYGKTASHFIEVDPECAYIREK